MRPVALAKKPTPTSIFLVFSIGVIYFSSFYEPALALPQPELEALQDLAAAIPRLTTLPQRPWNSSDASQACTVPWSGLYCDGGSVTSIDLNGLGLTGFLPNSIGNLSSLQYFSVFNNSLSGTIPASIANISALASVSFTANKFSGSLPPDLGKNQNFEGFYADANNLTGTIPQFIGGPALRYFYVGNNRLSGTIPPSMSLANQLEEIGIGNNDLEGPLFSLPASMKYVYVDRNRLNGSLPDLGALPNLIDFYASSNRFSGTLPPALASPLLRYLSLSRNLLSGPLPLSLPDSLLEVFLERNEFNGTIPPTFFSTPLLESLNLNFNRLSGTIPPTIGRLKRVKFLYLGGNSLGGTIPLGLSNLTLLEEFTLGTGNYSGCFSKSGSLLDSNCFLQSPVCSCPNSQCSAPMCPTCLASTTLACPLLPNGAGCLSNVECSSSYCSTGMVCQTPPPPIAAPIASPIAAPSAGTSGLDASTSPVGAIVGGIIGAIVVVAIIIVVVLVVAKMRRAKQPTPPPSDSVYASASELQPMKGGSLATASFKEEWIIPLEDLSFKAELGAGSYGTVWRGLLRGATDVAIKQSNLGGRSAEALSMFQKEAELMMTMRPHPNLIQTLGVASNGDSAYIIMELCPFGNVESLFGRGLLTTELKLSIVLGLAKAVDHLHANKIVHRDIAARNILLGNGNVPKLSDFGMSRNVQSATAQTATKTDVGPIRWMAPEAVESMTYSAASDVWTIGVTIIEIWNEKPPFHDEPNLLQVAKSLMNGVPPPIPSTMPPFLIKIVESCLRKSPSDRPSSSEVCKALMEHINS